jgi:hypothetical protein
MDEPGASLADAGATALPSRDELTKAWGDAVLEKLSQAAKLFLSNGRFVEAGSRDAVFALPAGGLLERARDHQQEAEGALAAYFGRPVPLRLVPDSVAQPYQGPTSPASARSTSSASSTSPASLASPASSTSSTSYDGYDLDDLVDSTEAAPLPIVPVEERILQAFPGSVLDG